MDTRPAVACAIITFSHGKHGPMLLLLQRGQMQSYPLYWSFPGGKIEKGEDPDIAAIRELKEETGIDLSKFTCPLANHITLDNPKYIFHIYHWHLPYKPDITLEDGFTGYGWFQCGRPWPTPNGPLLNDNNMTPHITSTLLRIPQ